MAISNGFFKTSRLLCTGGLAVSLTALIVGSAAAQSVGPLVRVAYGDPLAGCSADNVPLQEALFGGVNYPGTSIEPSIAVDPTDPSRMIGFHQQDRWSNGGSRSLVGVISKDGGKHWANSSPDGATLCQGGKYVRSTDPWVTFANDGTAIALIQVLDPAKSTTQFGTRNSGVMASRSTDHGVSWQAPVSLIENTNLNLLNDKISVTADPTHNGDAYATWDRLKILFGHFGGVIDLSGVANPRSIERLMMNSVVGGSLSCSPLGKAPCHAAGPAAAVGYTGPTLLSYTRDNGRTWSETVPIYEPGLNKQTINNIVRVLPNGDVLDFFQGIGTTPSGQSIGYVRSTNKGVTWSGPTYFIDVSGVGPVTPDSGGPIRSDAFIDSVAVNPVTGAITVAWQDYRFTSAMCTTPTGMIPIDSIAITQSLDGGLTWSTPIPVNQTPDNDASPCRQQAFSPTVTTTSDGSAVVVTYYDFRNDTNTPVGNEGTDFFAAICQVSSDCSKAASWSSEVKMTNASFNILNAPIAEGHFLGDYMGLAAGAPGQVVSLFGVSTGPNIVQEFSRTITTTSAR